MWINAVLFQAGWFFCVLEQGKLAVLAALIIVVLQYALLARQPHEALLLCLVVAWGFLQDFVLMQLEVFQVNQLSLPPLWLLALWLLFGTTLTRSLRWFHNRLWLAAIAGAITGPLSYLAGAKLGAIEISLARLPLLSLAWCLSTPLLLWLGKQLTTGERV